MHQLLVRLIHRAKEEQKMIHKEEKMATLSAIHNNEPTPNASKETHMKAARMHEYGKPPVLEDVPVPDIHPDEILVNVKACGMCRSDVQLVDGYFRKYADIPMPITLGHEITGVVQKIGGLVPKAAGFNEGDHVVVAPGWGDGTCRHCQVGNTQICPNVRWPGFGSVGGFAEYIPVPARYLIRVPDRLQFEQLAPLTDAGMTPYRGVKKLRDAGALGPDRVLGVFGVGGLGGYAVQYAKLLGGGATIVAFDRNSDNLAVAKEDGADAIISIKGKSSADIAKELSKAAGQSDLDAIIDCAGAPEMMQLGFSLLSISGHYADVGLVGDRIDIPLFPRVSREQTFHGSFWGNYTDLSEVMALAAQGKIRHTLKMFTFDQINEYFDLLRAGEVVGRAL